MATYHFNLSLSGFNFLYQNTLKTPPPCPCLFRYYFKLNNFLDVSVGSKVVKNITLLSKYIFVKCKVVVSFGATLRFENYLPHN